MKFDALRMYKSQGNVQQVAYAFETPEFDAALLHQAHPAVDGGRVSNRFWP